MIEVLINGETKALPVDTTVAKLLDQLAIKSRAVAVERNGTIIKKVDHPNCKLETGDLVEIVTLVGGG